MDERSWIVALAHEHLPGEVASSAEFVEGFRRLVGALSRRQPGSAHLVADVLAWLRPDGVVQHHAAFSWLETGQLCCILEFAVAARVTPDALDEHAEGVASVFTEALNLGRQGDVGGEGLK
jgi:hypothetical protein